jgi:xylose isomerase
MDVVILERPPGSPLIMNQSSTTIQLQRDFYATLTNGLEAFLELHYEAHVIWSGEDGYEVTLCPRLTYL